ncbi:MULTISPECIES: hypothetical protein [Pseudoalteromonas]|uniref:hypothetical protein n=1 Tax=Pseudoalteromonas TaxID=53246 RepID=UPI000A76197E|nr:MULTISPECIES: hypothetical protein [Pseudoalteromonas]
MKLKFKKTALKQLDKQQSLPQEQTPNIAGGANSRIPCRPPLTETGNQYWQCDC